MFQQRQHRRVSPLCAFFLLFLVGVVTKLHAFQLQQPVVMESSFSSTRITTTISSSAFVRKSTTANTALQMATWSNGQAIKQYHDFLITGSDGMEQTDDGGSVILTDGSNPILVNAINQMSMNSNDDVIITIPDVSILDGTTGFAGLPGLPKSLSVIEDNKEVMRDSYPIYFAVSPSNLDTVLKNLPKEYMDKSNDFVFISGSGSLGCIEPTLRLKNMARDSMTQVLLSGIDLNPKSQKLIVEDMSVYFGVDAGGVGEKWSGECAVCGKWTGAVSSRLERNNIRCRTMFYNEWRRHMWEWMAFVAVFNLVGGVRDEETSIADVATYYSQETSDMLWEVSKNLRGYLAVTLTYGFEERIFEYAEMRGAGNNDNCHPKCYVNDELYKLYLDMFTNSPMICEYIHYATTEKKLLSTDVVPKSVLQYGSGDVPQQTSMMRQGNLRSDGVI